MSTYTKPKRRWLRRIVGLVLVLAVAVSIYGYYRYSTTNPTVRDFAKQNGLSLSEWPEEL